MSSSNGSAPDLIRETLQPLVDHRETISGELAELEEQVTDKKGELKRIERLLREGGLIDPPTKPKKRKAGETSGTWVSEQMLEHARECLPDGPFTIRELTGLMEVSEGATRSAVDILRERRELRLLGNRPIGGSQGNRKAAHYEAVA